MAWCLLCTGQILSHVKYSIDLVLALQQAVEARNMNYATIVKNLRFSNLPWHDLQVWPDEVDEHFKNVKVNRLQDDASESASDSDIPSDSIEPELIQVG